MSSPKAARFSTPPTNPTSKTKAVLFDFMGTCLDWHHSISQSLPSTIPVTRRSDVALQWRQKFFTSISQRYSSGLPPEDIDTTHTDTLHELLSRPEHTDIKPLFSQSVVQTAVAAWHSQPAWPEVAEVLDCCRARGWEVFVLANGTTRLQLDLVRSAGLAFDMLFSSELLGVYKPAREAYETVLKLVGRQAGEVVMVAAHAYDLRAAKQLGFRTVYVCRWTDDLDEDQERLKDEFDVYLGDGMGGLVEAVLGLDDDDR